VKIGRVGGKTWLGHKMYFCALLYFCDIKLAHLEFCI